MFQQPFNVDEALKALQSGKDLTGKTLGNRRMDESACLVTKNIGKPYARFDEGGQVNVTMMKLLRHRQTKGAATDRFDLRCGKTVSYSTVFCS